MKNRIDIGIVMVNYNNYEDTIKCVESFFNHLDTKMFSIVIVDNASPNNSGLILKEKYKNHQNVTIILSNTNKGYSSGLNIGINYLKTNYDPSFVLLTNNDILLLDDDLFSKLDIEYSKSGCAAIGPMIFTPNGRYDSNPIFDTFYTKFNAEYDLRYFKKRLMATKLCLDWLFLFLRSLNPFVKIYKIKHFSARKHNDNQRCLVRRENVVLHGCCFILTKEYFNCFEELDARSFLFAEEDILYAHLVEKSLKTVYLPTVSVFHFDDSSIKKIHSHERRRKIFLFDNYIKAINDYLVLLNELDLNNYGQNKE